MGAIVFSPLAQGLLTDRYLQGIPAGSRASKPWGFLKASNITDDKLQKVAQLNALAQDRGQTLAQMALQWVLREGGADTLIVGARNPAQLTDSLRSLKAPDWTAGELDAIETILAGA